MPIVATSPRLALTALLLTTASLCHGQQLAQPAGVRSTVVKFNVFQPLVRGYHLEIEKQWRTHPRHSFSLTPQYYRGQVTELSSTDNDLQLGERVQGYGVELLHRVYIAAADEAPLTGFYVGYGPHFQRLKMDFQADGWREMLANDGLKYYQYGPIDYTETISRYGAAAVLGYQGPLNLGPVYFDFYVGLGYRGTSSRSALQESRYRSWLLDYAYKGVYLPAGFKIGVAL